MFSYNRNDVLFLADYPQAAKGIRALLDAIYDKREERGELIRRRSKNGTPEERDLVE